MNKTNKYKTQETLCYSFLSAWVIGIILIVFGIFIGIKRVKTKNKAIVIG